MQNKINNIQHFAFLELFICIFTYHTAVIWQNFWHDCLLLFWNFMKRLSGTCWHGNYGECPYFHDSLVVSYFRASLTTAKRANFLWSVHKRLAYCCVELWIGSTTFLCILELMLHSLNKRDQSSLLIYMSDNKGFSDMAVYKRVAVNCDVNAKQYLASFGVVSYVLNTCIMKWGVQN